MKYFKNYINFLNEKEEKDFELSLSGVFRPFAKLFSNIKTDIKLVSLINNYDKYLYDVYVEYIRNKNINIGSKIIDVVNKNGDIKIIDDDQIPDLVSSDINSDEGTSGHVNNGTNGNFTSNNDTTSNDDTINKEDITNDDIDKNYFNILKKLIKQGYMIDEEYENILQILIRFVKGKDINSIKIERDEYVEDLNKLKTDLEVEKSKILSFNKKIKKLSIDYEKSVGNDRIYLKAEIQKYNTLISKTNIFIGKINLKIKYNEWCVDAFNKTIDYMVNNSINESNDWRGGAVIDSEWSSEDMEEINKLVNPFQIEEFYLKADILINKSKNPEKFKNKWSLYLNSLYKKWYFTFDVRNLKTLSPKMSYSKNKDSNSSAKKDLTYSSIIMDELFPDSKSYSYKFRNLINDKNKYFILVWNNSILLFRKLFFKEGLYTFQFLSFLKSDNNGNGLTIDSFLNNDKKILKMQVGNKEIELFKEEKNYPIFIIKNGDLYLTTDFQTFNLIPLNNSIIYSIRNEYFKKIIKNSNKDFKDIIPSEDTFEKIKNLK